MFLFLKLYFAHLIGDFVLQFEELYRLKTRSWVGHVFHVLIHAAVSIVVVFPLLGRAEVWIFIAVITVLHLGEDLLKYRLQVLYPRLRFLLFTADQAVHAAVIALVFLLPLRTLKAGFPEHSVLDFYYSSNDWTLIGILFLVSTFGTAYFLHSLYLNYFKNARPDHFISRLELSHGLLERTAASGFFLLASPLSALGFTAALGLLRTAHPRLRSLRDFFLSAGAAAALGLLFRTWVNF